MKEMIPIQATMVVIVEMAVMEGIKASLPYFEYERKYEDLHMLGADITRFHIKPKMSGQECCQIK
jgi:hypothetical protein